MNDALLIKMIERDLACKGIRDYQLLDELAYNPKEISCDANEAIYVHWFKADNPQWLNIEMRSPLVGHTYNGENSFDGISTQIFGHWGPVKFEKKSETTFWIRYVRVTLIQKEQ